MGGHPHRGFETVTIAYAGEVAHRDSTGGGGVIRQGDVQWMTAGNGIVHEEFHSPEFSAHGGTFEMAQLWVNLPREAKRTPPRYRHLPSDTIPVMQTSAGSIRAGAEQELRLPENHNLALVLRHGQAELNGEHAISPSQLAVFEREAGSIRIRNTGSGTAELLLLSGLPIDEPVAAYGPFVMNTRAELAESIREYNAGKYGSLD